MIETKLPNFMGSALVIAFSLAAAGCKDQAPAESATQQAATTAAEDPIDIKAIDRRAGLMAREHGMAETVQTFFADEAIQLDDGKEAVDEGIYAIMLDHENTIPENLSVSWVPLGGEVAESGELAYTWGRWSNIEYQENGSMNDTYGKYVTIWRKQDDGSWKIVVDIWNSEDPSE